MIYIVLPAYNAEKTIKHTLLSIPNYKEYEFLLCDDASADNTVKVARELGLEVIIHSKNRGYGASQKTLYNIVLERFDLGSSSSTQNIVVMIHPDNQYDGNVIPKMIKLIINGKADFVLGNRMSGNLPYLGKMPVYKQLANKGLTKLQSYIYGVKMGEFHTGLRAYTRKVLETVNFNSFSNDFVFDSEMIASIIAHRFKVADIPVQARYFKQASSINLSKSVKYGLGTLKVLWKFKKGYYHQK